MSGMEICLLVIGMIIFVASFIVPEWKKDKNETTVISDEMVQQIIDKQMDDAKKKLEGVVDETVEYAVEKTERAAERISNEKIMAVNEYSDTVLNEINKNHEEVMFLYDMLNDKHKNITTAAIEVDKKAKAAEETAKEAEKKVLKVKETAENIQEQVKQETLIEKNQSEEKPKTAAENMIEMLGAKRIEISPNGTEKKEKEYGKLIQPVNEKIEKQEIVNEQDDESFNHNDKILELHKAGKTNVEIAKELELGVGEVSLVLNLYKGI